MLDGIQAFALAGPGNVRDKTMAALQALYTGFDHPAVDHAIGHGQGAQRRRARSPNAGTTPAAPYPGGGFANRLKDVARLIKAKVGLRVATIDLGGWDMHTNLGTVGGGEMRNQPRARWPTRSAPSPPTSARSSTTSRW